MNVTVKKTAAVLCCICAVLSFAACEKKENDGNPHSQYIYTPATTSEDPETASDGTVYDFSKSFPKDTSWQKNFSVKYKYYNAEQNASGAQIYEKRVASAFTVEYTDTGVKLYYKENGSDIDHYLISSVESENRHEVIKNQKISSLSSLFMKLTNVDPELPSQSNVLYMYDEIIAGRNCHKYIQRAYSDAKLTESVYVWVDAQYGFAMRCEDYDAADELKTMWEVTEFSAGNIDNEDVEVDISQYTFTEEVG